MVKGEGKKIVWWACDFEKGSQKLTNRKNATERGEVKQRVLSRKSVL